MMEIPKPGEDDRQFFRSLIPGDADVELSRCSAISAPL